MKEMNVGDLARLINEGFEGETVFTADVCLHGEGVTYIKYSGELAMCEDFSMNDRGRYTLVSKDTKLKIHFRKSREATIEHPSDGANRISVPVVLPRSCEIAIDNPQNIRY